MKKLIPFVLCAAMLLAGCGNTADTEATSSEAASVASESAATSEETTEPAADSTASEAPAEEAQTANLESAVAALEEVNPIANPRALDDFSVENELMLTMDLSLIHI